MCEFHRNIPAERVVDLGSLPQAQQTRARQTREDMNKIIPGGNVYWEPDVSKGKRNALTPATQDDKPTVFRREKPAPKPVEATPQPRTPRQERVIKPKTKKQLAREEARRRKKEAGANPDVQIMSDAQSLHQQQEAERLAQEIREIARAGGGKKGKRKRRRR